MFDSGREEPVFFLHDNANSHTAELTKQKLENLAWEVRPDLL